MPDLCRLCGGRLTGRAVLRIAGVPEGAQSFAGPGERSGRGITLTIRECPGCGLVQRTGGPVARHRDVITSAGLSQQMREHRTERFGDWVRRHGLAGAKVLEVGCGRGDMLPLLSAAGVRPVGLENSAAAEGIAGPEDIRIEHGYPTDTRPVPGGQFDAFVCLNFLEHAVDPAAFLKGIARSLTPEAVGLIEVPALEHDIASRCGYDWVADHLSYFTASTLETAVRLGGMELAEPIRRVWHDYDLEADVRRRPPSGARALSGALACAVDALDRWLARERRAGRTVAVWGASHQALTLISLSERRGDITCIVDSAPFKQGRRAPVTDIPIVAPAQLASRSPDSILVMAAGYTDEVVRALRDEHHFRGAVHALRGNDVVVA